MKTVYFRLKFILLFFCFLNFYSVFSQTQLTNIEYEQREFDIQNVLYFNSLDSNFVWFSDNQGIKTLNLKTKQIKKIMINDSVSAKSIAGCYIETSGKGKVLLIDSLSNYYFCTTNLGKISVIYDFNNRGINRREYFYPKFFMDFENFVFEHNNAVYRFEESICRKIDYFENIETITAKGKNWAIVTKDSISFNGTKRKIDIAFRPITENGSVDYHIPLFNNNNLLLYNRYKVVNISLRNKKIEVDSVLIFKDNIKIETRNDSTFIYEFYYNRAEKPVFSHSIYYLNKNKIDTVAKVYIRDYHGAQWEDERIRFVALTMYGTEFTGAVFFKKMNDKSVGFYYNPKGDLNGRFDKFTVENVQKNDSIYLIKMSVNHYLFYIKINHSQDSNSAITLRFKQRISTNEVLVQSENTLYILNLKTFDIEPFYAFPSKFTSFIKTSLSDFSVGKNNILMNFEGNYNFIKDYRKSEIHVINSSQLNSKTAYVMLEDSIFMIPPDVVKQNHEVQSFGKRSLYLISEVKPKILVLFDIKKQRYFQIEVDKNYKFLSIYILSEGIIYVQCKNLGFIWNNGKQTIVNNPIGFSLLKKVNNNEFWFITKDDYNRAFDVNYYINNEVKVIGQVVIENSNVYFTVLSEQNNIFKVDYYNKSDIYRIKDNKIQKVPTFSTGFLNDTWVDSLGNIYGKSYSKDGDILLFGENKKIIEIESNTVDIDKSSKVIINNSDLFFKGRYKDKFSIIKISKQSGQISYLDTEITQFLDYNDSFYFESFIGNEPYFFYLKNNEIFQLNTKPIVSSFFNFIDSKLYCYGSLKGKTPQIFRMDEPGKKVTSIPWVRVENKFLVGVEPLQPDLKINLFPNPFKDEINIEISSSLKINSILVLNIQGQLITSLECQNLQKSDIENTLKHILFELPSSMYILKINLESNRNLESRIFKILKN